MCRSKQSPASAGFSFPDAAMSYQLFVLLITVLALYLVFFGRV